jgi:hypothetical protein
MFQRFRVVWLFIALCLFIPLLVGCGGGSQVTALTPESLTSDQIASSTTSSSADQYVPRRISYIETWLEQHQSGALTPQDAESVALLSGLPLAAMQSVLMEGLPDPHRY